ncbi:MAG TPA: hypothetical protein VGJ89_03700 [Geothrix sp.]|jgi:hypothetical protein
MHKQCWAKCNIQVDESLISIIEALVKFPTLQTIESCQGDRIQAAWVNFYYGDNWNNDWRTTAEFLFDFLAPALFEEVGDSAHLSMRLHPSGTAIVDLTIRRECIEKVGHALNIIFLKFNSFRLHS